MTVVFQYDSCPYAIRATDTECKTEEGTITALLNRTLSLSAEASMT